MGHNNRVSCARTISFETKSHGSYRLGGTMTFESRPGYLRSFKITHTTHFVLFSPCFKPGCLVFCFGWFSFYLTSVQPLIVAVMLFNGTKSNDSLRTASPLGSQPPKWLQHTQEVHLRIHFTNSLSSDLFLQEDVTVPPKHTPPDC